MLRDLGPLLGWAIMTMASVVKIAAPVLLVGKSMRTLGLWSFRALVKSSRGEILSFSIEPPVLFLSLSIGARGLAASLDGSSQVA
jgi:hypothetical protein